MASECDIEWIFLILKRLISADPKGIDGGANLYANGDLNPLAFVDPYGLCADSFGCKALNFGGQVLDSGRQILNNATRGADYIFYNSVIAPIQLTQEHILDPLGLSNRPIVNRWAKFPWCRAPYHGQQRFRA